MTTTELHALRSAQLKELFHICTSLSPFDQHQVYRYVALCNDQYDTRNLSDKAREEIQTLAGRYLEQVK